MSIATVDPVEEFDESRLTQSDPVARMVEQTYLIGTDYIGEVNKVLLNQEEGTPVRTLDKTLKEAVEAENSDLPKEVVDAAKKAAKAREAAKAANEAARNALRKHYGEDEKASSEVSDEDKERAKNYRKAINDAISFLKTIAEANKNTALVEWANSLEVPQVGRQGTSTAGVRRPRVFVFVDDADVPKDSLTEAAKVVSTKDQKVTASDLAAAWNSALGDADGEFKAFDHTFRIQAKPKKSDESK